MKIKPLHKPKKTSTLVPYRTWIISFGLVLFLIIASSVIGGCDSAANQSSTPTPIPTPIIPIKPTYAVTRGDIVDIDHFTGRVAPVREVALAFGVNGRVDQVLVKSGDFVQAGDLLALLDSGNREYDLRRAKIQVKKSQLELDLARQQVEVNQQARSLSIMEKEYRWQQAQNELENLRTAGVSLTNLRQAEINLEMTRLDLDLARQQASLDLLAGETNLALREHDLELAQIAFSELEAFIADSQIVAPIDGKVVSVYVEEDTAAEAYRTAILLVDINDLMVRANLGSAELQRMEENLPVKISPVGNPGVILTGKIQSLPYPYGSGKSGQEDTYILIEDEFSPDEYNLGDLMEITVVLSEKTDILWLPPQAIRTFEGRKFVVIQDGEGQRRVDVKIGIEAEDRVEILEGLEEGQIVLSP